MADAREEHVWTKHAIDDHPYIEPYESAVYLEALLDLTEQVNTMIDCGCGSGLWAPIFRNYKYIGIDQNEAMLKIALQHFPSANLVSSNDELKEELLDKYSKTFIMHNFRQSLSSIFGSIKVDLAFCSAVLQHNRESDKVEFINTVRDVLRPKGYWVFTETTFTPTNFNPPFLRFEEGCTDGWSYTRKGWIEFMDKYGFSIIDKFAEDDKLFRANYYLFQKKD